MGFKRAALQVQCGVTDVQVAAKRREANTVQAVTDAFSEGLAAHSATAGTGSKSAVWDRGGIEPLPIL